LQESRQDLKQESEQDMKRTNEISLQSEETDVAPVRSKPNMNRQIQKIRRSAFTTLIVMTAFTLCYFFYWSLGVDFLVKYVKYYYYLEVTHMSNFYVLYIVRLSFKEYCNFVILCYVMILLNAIANPVIYLYSIRQQQTKDRPLPPDPSHHMNTIINGMKRIKLRTK